MKFIFIILTFLLASTLYAEPLAFKDEYVIRKRILTEDTSKVAETTLVATNKDVRMLGPAKIMGAYCPWEVGVTSCSPNYLYKAYTETVPPGMKEFPGVDAERAWSQAQGEGNVVAVLDTGVDLTHPDLKDNLWINDKEKQDGHDTDNNGCVDDIHGCSFVGGNQPQDRNGHGTHCSGIIGASANGIGVRGVAFSSKIIAVKILGDSGGGSVYGIVRGIDYVTALKRRGVNIVAINASFGSTGYSQPMADAIEDAGKAGILFVAAAGNDGTNNDNLPHYPSGYKLESILSVGAIDARGHLATFTNYGQRTVHLFAPGVSIYSTYPQGRYEYLSGTSMATPHVTGIASLLGGGVRERKNKIISFTEQRNAYTKKSITGGAANAYLAVNGGDGISCKKVKCQKCNADCKKKFSKKCDRIKCRSKCRETFNCIKGECKK